MMGGNKNSFLEQHLLTIITQSVMIAQAIKNTANKLKLNPAFLIKLASNDINL